MEKSLPTCLYPKALNNQRPSSEQQANASTDKSHWEIKRFNYGFIRFDDAKTLKTPHVAPCVKAQLTWKKGAACVVTRVLVFPLCCSEWIWPLSVWPLKSEKTKRDCPGLKGSFSQFTQNEHTHTHTLTQTHVKRVSNKHLYQEFKNKEASAPCVAAHPRLKTHTHTCADAMYLRGSHKHRKSAHPLTHIPQSHNSNLSWPVFCWMVVYSTVHSFLPVRKWDNRSLFDEKELTSGPDT